MKFYEKCPNKEVEKDLEKNQVYKKDNPVSSVTCDKEEIIEKNLKTTTYGNYNFLFEI